MLVNPNDFTSGDPTETYQLFEVSTPELEDVVRLQDDYGREGTTDRPS